MLLKHIEKYEHVITLFIILLLPIALYATYINELPVYATKPLDYLIAVLPTLILSGVLVFTFQKSIYIGPYIAITLIYWSYFLIEATTKSPVSGAFIDFTPPTVVDALATELAFFCFTVSYVFTIRYFKTNLFGIASHRRIGYILIASMATLLALLCGGLVFIASILFYFSLI